MQRPGEVFAPYVGPVVLPVEQAVLLIDEEAVWRRDQMRAVVPQQPGDTRRGTPGEQRTHVDASAERCALARQRAEGREPLTQAEPVRTGLEGERGARLAGGVAGGLPAGGTADAAHVRGAAYDQEVGGRDPVRGGFANRHHIEVRAETRTDRLGDSPGVAIHRLIDDKDSHGY